MSTVTIVFSKDHGWAIIAATAIGLECILTGAFSMNYARKTFFTPKFLEENFGKQHAEEIGGVIAKGGYPDMGNGRYAEKLSYREWLLFNNAARAHLNFTETVGITIPTILIASIHYPKQAAILGAIHFIGKLLYGIGYVKGGAKKRILGAIPATMSSFVVFIFAFASGVKLVRGLKK